MPKCEEKEGPRGGRGERAMERGQKKNIKQVLHFVLLLRFEKFRFFFF
jgi:hypothetical protein